ncbi:conserved protein of unknown function [Pseudorhizobium banfieldiae]|uniref:DUF924 domain-containing protein n=1 Tax=Pseudorhizobium banfieldiae TaxID=1125847 RepID=L0NHF7_9HYPH|nr:DUF924 family protein [Pseudorhizobium banfieldiae]CAD6611141.1 hypothetical protein RNT25_02358 [arsenite-oxidising bacterium NT-25]CCF19722.1 conserved protein of unknown function [Pseudorhizobium banfieldiae]
MEAPHIVLQFWFQELTRKEWFQVSAEVDAEISARFGRTHLDLARGEVTEWRGSPDQRLACIIVLDQFSRNIYRGTPLAFAADWIALREARMALEAGADMEVPEARRAFFYLPFEHSESVADQELSVRLFRKLGDPEYLDYAERHLAVIREFGRFPHRNALLGRESNSAELDYLSKPGAGF